jgi:hypothetical protein
MIKILTTCEIAELHTDIPCMDFKLDKVRWIKVEDVMFLIDSIYNKYVVPDNVNGVNTEHLVIGGVRFKTLVNHPISSMRAELLEQLEANQTKDFPENKDVLRTKDKQN